MKSGTTSLFHELSEFATIVTTIDKEPNVLTDAQSKSQAIVLYQRQFGRSRPSRIRLEASTEYTKMEAAQAASRALSWLEPNIRLIYMIRSPVERAISHYHHDFVRGSHKQSIREALLSPEPANPYIAVSRYLDRLRPWAERFPEDQIYIVRLEDYIVDHGRTMEGILSWLGLDDVVRTAPILENASSARPTLKGMWKTVARSGLYRSTLRRVLPPSLRSQIRYSLLPRGPVQLPQLGDDDHSKLTDLLWIECAAHLRAKSATLKDSSFLS